MKAVVCEAWGPPEKLIIKDVESPKVNNFAVKVEVWAAGVNFPDVLIIQGKYQYKPEFPFIPGSEIAGKIIQIGSNVTKFKIGDRVMAVTGHGAFAEEIVIAENKLTMIPNGIDYVTAASMSLTYGTSSFALIQRAKLLEDETVLIHGAAGGVGITAIEISKAMGAKVIATAGNKDKLNIAEKHGADYLIDYSKNKFKDQVKEITQGKGADVIYDPVGGDVFDQSLRCIAWNGRLLIIGFASGRIASAPTNLPLLKNCSIVGVFWGAWRDRNPTGHSKNMDQVFQWWKEKKINPRVSLTFTMENTKDALYALILRKVTGKAVIKIRD